MEREFVEWLRRTLPGHQALVVGPGDDAAVVDLGGDPMVVTVDVLTDRVDFELEKVDPRRVGHKALAVNLSDLAAMAARPVAAVIGLVLPKSGVDGPRKLTAEELAREIYHGLLPLAAKHDVAIAGGDTNTWDGPLVISVTAIGRPTARGVWRRSGARPGDVVMVTGQFGGSLLAKHLDVEPRVREALLLAERYEIRAAIDVSDGLSLDLVRLVQESSCGAVVELDRIPIAPAAIEWARERNDGSTALDHALSDGEDFELILVASPEEAKRLLDDQPLAIPIRRIGECIDAPGLWHSTSEGRQPLVARGFLHD